MESSGGTHGAGIPEGTSPRYPGVALGAFDCARCTEQVAILLSQSAGRQIYQWSEPKKNTAGKAEWRAVIPGPAQIGAWGLEAMLGYLRHGSLNPHLMHVDDDLLRHNDAKEDALPIDRGFTGAASHVWTTFLDKVSGGERAKTALYLDHDNRFLIRQLFVSQRSGGGMERFKAFDVDMTLCPVDGKKVLAAGQDGGTVSVIAGAQPGSFLEPRDMAPSYFVIAISKKVAEHINVDSLTDPVTRREPLNLTDFMKGRKLQSLITAAVKKLKSEPTIGLGAVYKTTAGSEEKDQSRWAEEFRTGIRCRQFQGSTIVGALAAFLQRFGIHAYVSMARRAHVVAMAVAAHALDGRLIAIPIERSIDAGQNEGPNIDRNRPILTERQIAKNRDDPKGRPEAFCAITGISETIVVRGIRFREDQIVSTQSLCLLSRTRSRRMIHHEYDLSEGRFYDLDLDLPIKFEAAVNDFRTKNYSDPRPKPKQDSDDAAKQPLRDIDKRG